MGKPFRSVLIANRGEIAVRIIRACREANLRAIAVYSDADANALHVRQAGEAHRLGPSPAVESYLRGDLIIATALNAGAEAIHPGYGFLSENADFAQAVLDAGLVWIGPPPSSMRLLGDKAAAKALAERVGVPTLPGYHGAAQDDATLTAQAARVGFPLLVKATAGGGGRGMRVVRAPDELPEALAAARREALAGFGSDRLLLERYLERPRHVEMQIFGDEHGTILYLGERDCSVQRRHQKIIEEAPAPNFSDQQRRAMGEASVALARAASYTNAGTVEYLLDADGRFYFLEVNTRLQVEHPVTEMVTGLDLVQLQFNVASGERLPIQQEDLRIAGHAIECRLYAEDPERDFLPSPGVLTRLRWPELNELMIRVRIDAGYETGDVVSPYYDALIAKVISCFANRDGAIAAQQSVWRTFRLEGVRSNHRALQAVLESPQFVGGAPHTGLVDELGLGSGPIVPGNDLLIAAAASLVLVKTELDIAPGDRASSATVWGQAGPWRTGWAGASVRFQYDEHLLTIGIHPPVYPSDGWWFELPAGSVNARVTLSGHHQVDVEIDHISTRVTVVRWPRGLTATAGRRSASLTLVSGSESSALQASRLPAPLEGKVRAPMPGRITRVAVRRGDSVEQNQALVVLEAMKIEQVVTAPRDGIVATVACQEGEQVDLGAILVELEDPS